MNSDPITEIRSLASGVRVVVVGFTLILAAFNARVSLQIDTYRQIFEDALPGQTLPTLTNLVIHAQVAWIVYSIILPIIAVLIALLVRDHFRALSGISIIMILAFIQANLTTTALLSPMFKLMTGISDGK